MIFDSTNKLSTAQAFTATAVSTNVIDLGVAGRDIGNGESVPLYVGVNTTFTGLTSLQVVVQASVDEAFTVPIVILQSPVVLAASLVAGYQFAITEAPINIEARYLRLSYVVVGTATAGSIDAGVTMGNQRNG